MSEDSEAPSASPEDTFGPPHAQHVSENLQMWILVPGLLILAVIGEIPSVAFLLVLSLMIISPGFGQGKFKSPLSALYSKTYSLPSRPVIVSCFVSTIN